MTAPPALEAVGRRFVHEAEDEGLLLRLTGSAAVKLQAARYGRYLEALGRAVKDLDFAAYAEAAERIRTFFTTRGFREDPELAVLLAGQRMILDHPQTGVHADVFFDRLDFCHEIVLRGRLEVHPVTLPPAEVLLSKLQIVNLTPNDLADALVLVLQHPLVDGHDRGIDATLIAQHCARNWGLWRTLTGNLERLRTFVRDCEALEDTDRLRAFVQIDALGARLAREPKSAGWKLRNRLGDWVKWYKDVEDPA